MLLSLIAPRVCSADLSRVFSIFGEALNILASKTPTWPSPPILCSETFFTTRITFVGRSYISELYSHQIAGSSKIPRDDLCKYIAVELDDIGITVIQFLPAEADLPIPVSESWVYAIADSSKLYARQKVSGTEAISILLTRLRATFLSVLPVHRT